MSIEVFRLDTPSLFSVILLFSSIGNKSFPTYVAGYCGLVQVSEEECLSSGSRWTSCSANASFGSSPKHNPLGTPGEAIQERSLIEDEQHTMVSSVISTNL